MASPEKIGEQIWKEFHEALKSELWKAFGILREGYVLFRTAVESFDVGAIEGSVLLCRATLESSLLIFLSIQWSSASSFNIYPPTTLDGKLRLVGFDELRNAIVQRISFSKEQVKAIDRVHEDGNFVAHLASRMFKQRELRVKKYREWESNRRIVTDVDRMKQIRRILKSEKSLVTRADALQDLRDNASIMVTLGKAAGKS